MLESFSFDPHSIAYSFTKDSDIEKILSTTFYVRSDLSSLTAVPVDADTASSMPSLLFILAYNQTKRKPTKGAKLKILISLSQPAISPSPVQDLL